MGRRAVDRVGDAFAFRPDRVTVIRPAARWPRLDLRELWHYRELLGRFVWRDVKVRYKQTFIGIAWAILQPFLTMVVFTLVFGKFAKFPNQGQQYPVSCTRVCCFGRTSRRALVRGEHEPLLQCSARHKVYFPRVLLPAGAALVPIVDLAMASTVLVGLMAYYHTPIGDMAYLAPAFLLLAVGDRTRHRVVLLGAQRSLPRRAIRLSLSSCRPGSTSHPLSIRSPLCP